MFLPRNMPLLRSWAVLFIIISLVCVQINSAAKLVAENVDYKTDVGNFKIIKRTGALELKCSIDEPGFTILWRKDDEEVKEAAITTEVSKDKETSTLKIAKPGDADAGVYVCSAKSNATEAVEGGLEASFKVFSMPVGSLEQDNIVVEGEKLTLDCQPSGSPVPEVKWMMVKDNATLITSNERIKLLPHNNISNAILEIRDVQMSDRGEYKCVLTNAASLLEGKGVEYKTKVRVKDKLAALWPFLGICAEVIVLCAIIFIYEKKRNKAELDESDTDNSPEQKNTPDHGKDSVRQRK